MGAERKRCRMERRIVELLRLGRGMNALSVELGVCKKRLKRVRELAEKRGYLDLEKPLPAAPAALFPEIRDGRTTRGSEIDERLQPHRAWITERLEAGWHPITVFEELPDRGIGRSSFYRFLHRHELLSGRSKRVIAPIVDAAGSVLYVDWGKLCTAMIGGRRVPVWAFIGVLGYSRYRVVRLMTSCTVEHTLAALSSMYEELGGVPVRTVTDNPKVFSLLADPYEALLNPVAERFASHYGTVLECLPPKTPQLKGKVERQVPFIRRLFESHGEWVSLEESGDFLSRKLELANAGKHGTTGEAPAERFMGKEQEALKPLPITPYQREEYHSGTVRRDGHVRFRGKYYSVEARFIGKEVVVLGTSSQVSIYHQGTLLEVHARCGHGVEHATKQHHLTPWERSMADDSLLRLRGRRLGPAVEEMVVRLLAPGLGFIDYRRIWGLLNLDKKFEAAAINSACATALALGKVGYLVVKELLRNAVPIAERAPAPRRGHGTNKYLTPIEEYQQVVRLRLIEGRKQDEPGNDTTAALRVKNAHCRS